MNRASRKIVVELLTAVAVVVFLELVLSAGSLGQPAGSPGDVEEQVGQLIKQWEMKVGKSENGQRGNWYSWGPRLWKPYGGR